MTPGLTQTLLLNGHAADVQRNKYVYCSSCATVTKEGAIYCCLLAYFTPSIQSQQSQNSETLNDHFYAIWNTYATCELTE